MEGANDKLGVLKRMACGFVNARNFQTRRILLTRRNTSRDDRHPMVAKNPLFGGEARAVRFRTSVFALVVGSRQESYIHQEECCQSDNNVEEMGL